MADEHNQEPHAPTVLIVDDDEAIMEMNQRGFEAKGFEAVACLDGFQAIREIARRRFDAIVTDYMMPGMDGLQFIAYSKVNELNARTPIIVLSGRLNEGTTDRLAKAGVIDIVPKPYDIDDIVTRVVQRLHRPGDGQEYDQGLVDIFQQVTEQVLTFYFPEGLALGQAALRNDFSPLGKYSSAVALFGRRVFGALGFSCDRAFMEIFCRNLFHTEALELGDGFYTDVMGEIVKQLAGELKIRLAARGVQIVTGLPEVSRYGEASFAKLEAPRLCVPAQIEGAECHVEFLCGNADAFGAGDDPTFAVFSGSQNSAS